MYLHKYGINFESWVFFNRSAVEKSIDMFIYKGSGSLRPLTAEACFRSRASQCEFYGGQCGKEICEIKCQIDATEVFISDLIACSTCFGHHYAHHPELKSIIQWLLPVVLRAVVFKLLVWCGAEG